MEQPSSQKGMQTPDMESRIWKPPFGSDIMAKSQRPSCLSLILEKPVVAMRFLSPIQTARLFLAPAWPWKGKRRCHEERARIRIHTGTSWAAFSILVSQILNFLSRLVVTIMEPSALHDMDWTISLCFRTSRSLPCSMSHSLIVKSPDELARTF